MVGNEPFIDFKEKTYEGSIQKIKDELESVSIHFWERAITYSFTSYYTLGWFFEGLDLIDKSGEDIFYVESKADLNAGDFATILDELRQLELVKV